jgi:hypothetical protein
MVARTLPFKSRDKLRNNPNEEFPSIPPEKMESQQSVAEQLRHAREQQELEKSYPR